MGRNWHDPAEIMRDAKIAAAFVLVLCGVAAWDLLSTLAFDLSIIRGKRPWRWPMLLYFIARICMVLHVFSHAVNLNAIDEIPCQQVTWISKVSDVVGINAAILILVLRTRAVWHQDFRVTIFLCALFCGEVAVWCMTFRYSVARWNPQRKVCAVVATAPRSLLVTVYSYTMAFDLIILLLCLYKLTKTRSSGGLAALLFRDGIFYFCAAFGANLVQMVLASLALNPVMNIIALPFALVVSVIAATTVFRNVFVAHDAFSEHSASSSSGHRRISDFSLNRLGFPRIHLTNASSHITTSEIPLKQYKAGRGDAPRVSVQKAVDDNSSQWMTQSDKQDSLQEKGLAL